MAESGKQRTTADEAVLRRLAGRGEEALHRLGGFPGGRRAVKAMNDLRLRVDDLSRRMRGIDALEKRVAKLEKELAALKGQKTSQRKPAA